MMDAWLAIRGGRTLIQHKARPLLPELHATLEDVVLLPKLQDLLLHTGELYFAIHRIKHGTLRLNNKSPAEPGVATRNI
jgi:hypothetical protein